MHCGKCTIRKWIYRHVCVYFLSAIATFLLFHSVNDHCRGWVTPFQWTSGMRQKNASHYIVLQLSIVWLNSFIILPHSAPSWILSLAESPRWSPSVAIMWCIFLSHSTGSLEGGYPTSAVVIDRLKYFNWCSRFIWDRSHGNTKSH